MKKSKDKPMGHKVFVEKYLSELVDELPDGNERNLAWLTARCMKRTRRHHAKIGIAPRKIMVLEEKLEEIRALLKKRASENADILELEASLFSASISSMAT